MDKSYTDRLMIAAMAGSFLSLVVMIVLWVLE
jgi:hypothetical protein